MECRVSSMKHMYVRTHSWVNDPQLDNFGYIQVIGNEVCMVSIRDITMYMNKTVQICVTSKYKDPCFLIQINSVYLEIL